MDDRAFGEKLFDVTSSPSNTPTRKSSAFMHRGRPIASRPWSRCARRCIAASEPSKLDERAVVGGNVAPESLGPVSQILKYSGEPRTIATSDVGALVRHATASGALIAMACAVGDTLVEGTVILRVHGAKEPLDEKQLMKAVHLGTDRTFEQDPNYAIRLLVDIAIKALSPAINDPTTAVQALDQIEDPQDQFEYRRDRPEYYPFAGIAFLWFIGVLRDRLGQRQDRFFATVFFGSTSCSLRCCSLHPRWWGPSFSSSLSSRTSSSKPRRSTSRVPPSTA
jgi:Predicted membrane protein (DUF2254)